MARATTEQLSEWRETAKRLLTAAGNGEFGPADPDRIYDLAILTTLAIPLLTDEVERFRANSALVQRLMDLSWEEHAQCGGDCDVRNTLFSIEEES